MGPPANRNDDELAAYREGQRDGNKACRAERKVRDRQEANAEELAELLEEGAQS